MPKVSVIIPVYGVERYIERCADSLFQQTLDEIEFIFVDDCSPDRSMDLLHKKILEYRPSFAKMAWTVRIEKMPTNSGLPAVRRHGIQLATGDYIIHCDSDDWVDVDMYRTMYEKALVENVDMVICEYYISDGKNNKFYGIPETSGLLMGPLWNKLINRSLYENDIEFPTANKAEDGAIMTQISYYSQKRAYIHKPLYYYYSNPASICRKIDERSCISKMEQECKNVEIRLNFLKRQGALSKYSRDITIWKFEARNNLIPCIAKRNIFDLWRNTYPEIDSQIFKSGNIRMIVKYLLLRYKLYFLIK